MKQNKRLKNAINIIVILLFIFLTFFTYINYSEYKKYNQNYNQKLSNIISLVQEKYPEITENEILELLNNKQETNNILEKYGIDINNDAYIVNNNKIYKKYTVIKLSFISISIITITIIFLIYNYKKEKDIKEITKCIEEINKKNYKLNLDDMIEDELSILKNELYKITIKLKEDAENSKKEKIELKESLSNISHQLKTPLTSMLIIIDNLIDNPEMDIKTRNEFERDLKKEITNLSFFVQLILKLSKLDTNTVTFINKKEDILEIVKESKSRLSTLCDLKNISININSENKNELLCDYKWQVEAISNILKNCIEHSNNDSNIDINIKSNKVFLTIEIQDYGEGIDKEDINHIFERFYKTKNSKGDSIGIGLSLSKMIIEKNNGMIRVESEKDKGTKFIIKYMI